MRLCLNLGGSRGSICRCWILKMRVLPCASPICAVGVYRTNVGSSFLRPCTFFGRCAAVCPETRAMRACSVFSLVACTTSWLGLAKSSSPASARCRRGIKSLKLACTIRDSPWPRRAMSSYCVFPSPSTLRTSAFDDEAVPFLPMSSGYCATCTSGNAPPSPKSSAARGRQLLLLP